MAELLNLSGLKVRVVLITNESYYGVISFGKDGKTGKMFVEVVTDDNSYYFNLDEVAVIENVSGEYVDLSIAM